MRTLDQIGVERGTDKSSLHHHYLGLYEILFGWMKNEPIGILEVGVQFGNSIRTWREYFPNAYIVGIDSIDNGVTFPEESGVRIIIHDAYQNIVADKFDIIIDDGSHFPKDQVEFIRLYSPLLTDRGILIVEDVPTADVIPELAKELPEGFQWTAIDMTQGDSIVDSRLFIATRQQSGKLSEAEKGNVSPASRQNGWYQPPS